MKLAPGRLHRDPFAAALVGVFLISRLAFHAAGVRFDASPLEVYWQFLDPRWLQDDLGRSLLYLHSQPPLFNLFLGTVLKLAPSHPEAVFRVVYPVLGLTTCLATYTAMRRVGVSGRPAFLVAAILTLRPGTVLYESWLTYDAPVAAALAVAAVLLAPPGEARSALRTHAFFVVLALICATRSLFHPIWLVGVAVLVARLEGSRRPLRAALGPALVLAALLLKSFLLFGQATTSTWLGMSLWRVASTEIEASEIARLQAEGALSEVAAIPPFSPPEAYPDRYLADPPYPDVPAVTATRRSTGHPNYNHAAYVGIARDYLGDALWMLRHRPGDYALGVAKAWYYYLSPPGQVPQVAANRDALGAYADRFESVLYGRLPEAVRYRDRPRPTYLVSTLGIPALLVAALVEIRRRRRRGESTVALAFLLLTTVYVAVVGNAFEILENARFRFSTDPFLAVFAGLVAERAGQRLQDAVRRRKSRKSPPTG